MSDLISLIHHFNLPYTNASTNTELRPSIVKFFNLRALYYTVLCRDWSVLFTKLTRSILLLIIPINSAASATSSNIDHLASPPAILSFPVSPLQFVSKTFASHQIRKKIQTPKQTLAFHGIWKQKNLILILQIFFSGNSISRKSNTSLSIFSSFPFSLHSHETDRRKSMRSWICRKSLRMGNS